MAAQEGLEAVAPGERRWRGGDAGVLVEPDFQVVDVAELLECELWMILAEDVAELFALSSTATK